MNPVPRYHQASKHSLDRFAPGPGYMDWESQPEPFRWYDGTAVHPLPVEPSGEDPPFAALLKPGAIPPQPLNLESLSRLFLYSFGLAAWKEYMGERWALRCHPSSGNLHPIESFLIAPSPLFAGVHHYLSRDHVLESRWRPGANHDWDTAFPPGTLLIGLSLIHRRETWKYGLRAYRYGQLNLGHAAATLSYSAAILGWQVTLRADGSDDDLAVLSGLAQSPSQDEEHPGLWLEVNTRSHPASPGIDLARLAKLVTTGSWLGRPNSLGSSPPMPWPGVEEATRTFRKTSGGWTAEPAFVALPDLIPAPMQRPAGALIRGRRSAQRYDGRTILSLQAFCRILDRLLPRPGLPPWGVAPPTPCIHPVLLVHRVEVIPPGLYLLPRSSAVLPALQAALPSTPAWRTLTAIPDHLHLLLLREGDFREIATLISCRQEIAADGAFTLGMLADFQANPAEDPWNYRALHWEAGMLGQVLYLAAGEEGMQGTGIGCFFDDLFHQWLELEGQRFQTVYHFTVGQALNDRRLMTHHPYAHLRQRG
ncbi:MAG: SagB/ThcOx family dehydrogenase [Magnetococcales bacterium]|nr:SagB/ThcOx family dehydrogenase [Magnetococcales bacterium]